MVSVNFPNSSELYPDLLNLSSADNFLTYDNFKMANAPSGAIIAYFHKDPKPLTAVLPMTKIFNHGKPGFVPPTAKTVVTVYWGTGKKKHEAIVLEVEHGELLLSYPRHETYLVKLTAVVHRRSNGGGWKDSEDQRDWEWPAQLPQTRRDILEGHEPLHVCCEWWRQRRGNLAFNLSLSMCVRCSAL